MTNTVLPAEKTLLLVDDDKPFLTRLARAMETRGFEVPTAESVAEGVAHVKRTAPSFAVVDLRLADGNGLRCDRGAPPGTARCPGSRVDWLWQHCNRGHGGEARCDRLSCQTCLTPMPFMARWLGIQTAVLPFRTIPCQPIESAGNTSSGFSELCSRNVSETARRLNMHRRTLQRILAKRAPK